MVFNKTHQYKIARKFMQRKPNCSLRRLRFIWQAGRHEVTNDAGQIITVNNWKLNTYRIYRHVP